MIAPLNCDECRMQYRCTHISTDCKYPEGRQYGVTTYDKMRADERSALEKRLEEAEKVIDDVVRGRDLCHENGIEIKPIFLSRIMHAEDYRAKYPRTKGGE